MRKLSTAMSTSSIPTKTNEVYCMCTTAKLSLVKIIDNGSLKIFKIGLNKLSLYSLK